MVYAHAGVVAAGTVVVVEEGETCCGITDGRIAGVYTAGRHEVVHALTAAIFVRHRLSGLQFGGSLGGMVDSRHASGQVRAFGQMVLEIVDPPAFVLASGAPTETEALVDASRSAALPALASAVEEALARGDIALAGLAALPPAVLGRAAEIFRTSPRAIPGVQIELTSASAHVMDLVEPPPAAAPPPAPAMEGFAPGHPVLVQWSDGNRYPAQVVQAAGDRCLVSFQNGAQDWVPNAYLSPA